MTSLGAALLVMSSNVSWGGDWAWGLPLVVLTVVLHVIGLGVVRTTAFETFHRSSRRNVNASFVVVIGTATLLATVLHAIEAALWAVAYRVLGALPDASTAILYSLNAITSYGHIAVDLEPKWRLMGALESLNGWLLFGLTTAFMFAIFERIWSEAQPKRMGAGSR